MEIGTLLEVLKYTIPALVVLAATYLIINKFLVTEIQRKQIALFQETQNITLPLRLQAYERLAIFVERLNPRQLLPRVYDPAMNVAEFQQVLLFNVRSEFEHNLSQQVYVSKEVWETVKSVKEQEMNMVNVIASQLKPEAPAKELHVRIIDYVLTSATALPTDLALQVINEECKRVLARGPQA